MASDTLVYSALVLSMAVGAVIVVGGIFAQNGIGTIAAVGSVFILVSVGGLAYLAAETEPDAEPEPVSTTATEPSTDDAGPGHGGKIS
ncbi:hypothetical protein [Natrinema sp. 1APR25-10V2]|uniref:hypothetical protein n=1 Tax=Natrinema sp. 1APR25-10V2 TaxID=2951081 RepID=UPI002875B11F|nr:hypothetical protein [Natrinema sp. 1APR25-10V2]MDS0475741.1 hypothetical protein [Natrinema sp. 1APR25-10V2]